MFYVQGKVEKQNIKKNDRRTCVGGGNILIPFGRKEMDIALGIVILIHMADRTVISKVCIDGLRLESGAKRQ